MTITTTFEITDVMITGAAITILLSIIAIIVNRKLTSGVPGKLQNIVEWGVDSLRNMYAGIIGKERADQFLPVLGTMFIFILVSNYSGILPGSGHLPGLKAPTAHLGCTLALALVIFFTTHIGGFRAHKLGYFKHFISPVFFMLPFLIIEEVVRPVSLALRLYGNIYGEETVTERLFELIPIGAPVVMQGLGLMFGLIQAMVFTMLAAIYIDGAAGDSH